MIKIGRFVWNDNVFEKDEFDKNLPKYLQHDIDLVLNGIRNNEELSIDLYLDELYGSINSAYWDKQIDKEHANHLRHKYLGYV